MTMIYNNIIFFDGECIFCNHFIEFVIKRDGGKFKLSHLQSDFAKQQSQKNSFTISSNMDSIYLLRGDQIYGKSDATLEILRQIHFPWSFLGLSLKIFPKFIRDYIYDVIGRNRHRIFSSKSCTLRCNIIKNRIIK